MDDELRIGDFTIEPQLNRISRGDRKVQIEAKSVEVLLFLSQHPNEVLPKGRILQAVWPDTFVTDDVLTHAVSVLRKAFGDDPGDPQYIQTIPRKGYRLIADVAKPEPESRYRKLDILGRGAMGEVFLAEDRLLKRKVALKFVLQGEDEDESALRRLRREALAAAALDHPFICKVYETGDLGGRVFIAMEYVSGQTLKERLSAGPLPAEQAVRIAIEMAEALEIAHTKGIVHRDLKPSNVILSEQGHVKITDFGIAKRLVAEGNGQDFTATLAAERSSPGTLPYMSPEQVKGQELDTRSDIFSLGVLLYEMLTGVNPFRKPLPMETAAAIQTETQPPLTRYIQWSSEQTQQTVDKMLAKDVKERYSSVHDLQTQLEKLPELFGQPRAALPGQSAGKRWIAWAAMAAAAVVAALIAFHQLVSPQLWREPTDVVLEPVLLTSYPGVEKQPTFSPDGSQVAFVWNGERRDNYDIYVQTVGAAQPARLTTSPASDFSPAWSPNGRQIAFLRSRGQGPAGIFLVPPTGGKERKVAELWHMSDVPTVAWSPDGKFLAFPDGGLDEERGIFLLSLETGDRTRLTTAPDPADRDQVPVFSPGGETIFFLRSATEAERDLYSVSVTGGEPQFVSRALRSASMALTPDGTELVLGRGRLQRVSLAGDARRTLAGIEGNDPAISRRGRSLAFARQERDTNIWRFDLKGTGPDAGVPFIISTQMDVNPQFSRDGNRITFSSYRSGDSEIWVCGRDGANLLRLTEDGGCGSPRWSPDGEWIAYDKDDDIHVVSSRGGGTWQVTSETSRETLPSWSSDGRWIYFASDRTGEFQVWKTLFKPEAGEADSAIQMTRHGGFRPIESLDGRYLYYFELGQGAIRRVPVSGGEDTRVLKSHSTHYANWDIARNGIYFVDWRDVPTLHWADMPLFATNMKWIVRFLSFDDGTVSEVAEQQRIPFVGPALGVSPDGRWLLSALHEREESDLMLVENFR